MTTPITVTLTPYTIIWRYQGDISEGLISNAKLELLLKKVWKDENGTIYKEEALPTISGTPIELGLMEEFLSIQAKLDVAIASFIAPSEESLVEENITEQ